ncbi:MAG TPA: polyprenyl synthetase family protein [Sulfolobales archaeon]|nr:polyprenyl synthetase family protein [Sulfolobales archaeon]
MDLSLSIDLEVLRGYVESRKSMIESALESVIKNYEGEVLEIVNYMSRGGKRFRGVLTILVCESLGGRVEDAIDAAVAVELVHAASLALDDIIDLDYIRRGSLSSWIKYGVSKTILIANMLIPKAQLMIERYGFEALVKVIEAWLHATSGEVIDVFGPGPGIASYETLARLKTGAVFRAATFLGAKAAKAGKSYEDLAAAFGENLGVLYQVADDLVDVITNKIEGGSRGLEMFIEWAGGGSVEEIISRVSPKIASMLEKLGTIVARFPNNQYRDYLATVPGYMLYGMLREAGDMGEEVFKRIMEFYLKP